MAKHAVSTDQTQERALLTLMSAYNARMAACIPPGVQVTADQYFEMLSQPLLEQIVIDGNVTTSDDILRAVKAAIDSGNDAKINAVKNALGLP